jgi:hypothetical protein
MQDFKRSALFYFEICKRGFLIKMQRGKKKKIEFMQRVESETFFLSN